MRHIIFRAWDKTRDEMFCYENMSGIKELYFTQDMSVDSIKLFEYLPNGSFTFKDLNINDVELMQYTGLLDKNGVKIFEGDILFYHSSRKSGNVVVECVMGTFGFDCIDKTQGWQLLGLYNQFCEVIGNKFENPELLGENK